MEALERKQVSVITKYALETFSEGDWLTLAQITGRLALVTGHPRLLRSLGFGDEDYDLCVTDVLDAIFTEDPSQIPEVIQHFDIDLWYEQKEPDKYKRVFGGKAITQADFWDAGYLKVFISHLSANKQRMSFMKKYFAKWGVSAFIAHEDIEPTREWREEVEAALETMDVMVAVVEPGFKESDWCCQEVGYALGRTIEVIPLRAGMDPFGFFGKYQGIQIKGRMPKDAAHDIVKLLLRKPKCRSRLLQSMSKGFSSQPSKEKVSLVKTLDSWKVLTDDQLKETCERSSISEYEKDKLRDIIDRVGALQAKEPLSQTQDVSDDIPF